MAEVQDLIILGGGCAGLALAREIAKTGCELKVAVIEPRLAYEEDRTWCFWVRDDEIVKPAPAAQWRQWNFSASGSGSCSAMDTASGPDSRVVHHAKDWRYVLVRSADYYAEALRQIALSSTICLHSGQRGGELRMEKGLCGVEVDGTMMFGRHVVDTRPPGKERLLAATFAQVFSGIEIETDDDCFDAKTATLMGNLRVNGGSLAFDYLLPLTPRRALYEHTVFSSTPLAITALDETCRQRALLYGGIQARIVREERGWIPMGLPKQEATCGPVFSAGMNGGAVRPSSGYAFRRIQKWAEACARALVTVGRPIAAPEEGLVTAFMDRVFMAAMKRNPTNAPAYFFETARALDGDGFARFMSDEPSLLDWARVVAGLPKGDFLGALAAQLFPGKAAVKRAC